MVFISTLSVAQNKNRKNDNGMRLGALAGMGLMNQTISDVPATQSISTSSLFTLHLGLVGLIPINDNLSFQPGFEFQQKGCKYKATTATLTIDTKISFIYLNVPLNLVYSMGSDDLKFTPFLGLYGAYAIYGEHGLGGLNDKADFSREYKRPDFGAQAGIGVDVDEFFFRAQYSLGFANIARSDNMDGTKSSNKGFSLSVGRWIK